MPSSYHLGSDSKLHREQRREKRTDGEDQGKDGKHEEGSPALEGVFSSLDISLPQQRNREGKRAAADPKPENRVKAHRCLVAPSDSRAGCLVPKWCGMFAVDHTRDDEAFDVASCLVSSADRRCSNSEAG